MPENSEREPSDPHTPPVPGFTEALNVLSNPELLSALDLTLLELEKRLLSYARGGPEVLAMADGGIGAGG